MTTLNEIDHSQGTVSLIRAADSTLLIRLAGHWRLRRDVPSADIVRSELEAKAPPRRIGFDAKVLTAWDSGLVSFLVDVSALCHQRGITADHGGLPAGLRRLLELAEAVPEEKGARQETARASFLTRVGDQAIAYASAVHEALGFLGDFAIASRHFARGKARYRKVDLTESIQDCGANAVGIVTLIAFLVGLILAFMGAVELAQFGAAIYVADMVGIGMIREMGAMMAAIIMSGRTGAAFAAQLGTMKVTQEIDALTTMGISPMEFLVLPRVLALTLMMPLLCLYSDFVGILGGASVGIVMLGLSPANYFHETVAALSFNNLFLGVFKATVYGFLIGIAGCLRGFQCGGSSSAVGDAATRAVVSSIVLVVLACGLFAVITNLIGL